MALAREDFLAHLQARGAEPEGPQALHAGDLYLACACARGLPEALALFEHHHLPAARQALVRRGLALTELRERAVRPAAALESRLLPAEDASFEALKHRHREDFEAALRAALAALEPRERTILRLHLVEGIGVEDIGRVHGVSRATMTRWLKAARDTLEERARAELHQRLGVGSSELHSLARSLLDQLDVSVVGLLR